MIRPYSILLSTCLLLSSLASAQDRANERKPRFGPAIRPPVTDAPTAPAPRGAPVANPPALGGGNGPDAVQVCPTGVQDMANPMTCLPASSVPALGALYPLGNELSILPTGEVGIGTIIPEHRLDVVGDLRSRERVALGNQAVIGQSGNLHGVFDIAHHVEDFSAGDTWALLRSNMTVDPVSDLTGPDASYVFSHMLTATVPAGNDRDISYYQGPYCAAFAVGEGTIEILAGAGAVGQSLGLAHTLDQTGIYSAATANNNSTVDANYSIYAYTGSRDSASVGKNFTIFVERPFGESSIEENYGVYIAKQDRGNVRNYALYAEGGDTYFGDKVGIGTDAPLSDLHVVGSGLFRGTGGGLSVSPQADHVNLSYSQTNGSFTNMTFRWGSTQFNGDVAIGATPAGYKLQVGAAGDGSEARANAWNLLSSREYKRDVEPFAAEDYADVLAKIEDLDVVRYVYTGDEDAREHVGLIAEDSPEEILGKDGRSLSLGDYTSFLLAGLKAQQTEIEDQRAELDTLRAELAELRRLVTKE